MSRPGLTFSFACPLCASEPEVTGTLEPTPRGRWDGEVPSSPIVETLVGCAHAEAFQAGKLRGDGGRAMTQAVDRAVIEACEAAWEDSQDAAYDTLEEKWESER